jgi:hypothetical protein
LLPARQRRRRGDAALVVAWLVKHGYTHAGATLTKPPTDAEFFVGRDAYFADPSTTTGRPRMHPATTPWS